VCLGKDWTTRLLKSRAATHCKGPGRQETGKGRSSLPLTGQPGLPKTARSQEQAARHGTFSGRAGSLPIVCYQLPVPASKLLKTLSEKAPSPLAFSVERDDTVLEDAERVLWNNDPIFEENLYHFPLGAVGLFTSQR
jgi:hypothetical protein